MRRNAYGFLSQKEMLTVEPFVGKKQSCIVNINANLVTAVGLEPVPFCLITGRGMRTVDYHNHLICKVHRNQA